MSRKHQPSQTLSGLPPGFDLRTFTHFSASDGEIGSLECLLPLHFTADLEATWKRQAESRRWVHEKARHEAKLQKQELRQPAHIEPPQKTEPDGEGFSGRSAIDAEPEAKAPKADKATPIREPVRPKLGDLDVDAERAFLQHQAKQGERLHRRSFAQVLRARGDSGHLMAPVLAWDEVLKLIDRKGSTPDRDMKLRNRELFLRIRKDHPHHMRAVGYRLRDHQAVLDDLATIGEQLPHFVEVLAFVRDHLVLSFARQQPMRIPPVLLLGDPGIGKTHFTFELAKALRIPVRRHGFDASLTGSALLGSDKHWANTAHGLVFEELVLGHSASPICLLDEIDKAAEDTGNRNPLGPLHSLLEPVSAKAVTDISLDITLNASHIVWVATANEPWKIPAPIRSRMREFMIEAPKGEHAIHAAQAVAQAVYGRMGPDLFDPPEPRLIRSLAHLSARELIQVLEAGYARALSSGSRVLKRHHLPADMLYELDEQPGGPDASPSGGYVH